MLMQHIFRTVIIFAVMACNCLYAKLKLPSSFYQATIEQKNPSQPLETTLKEAFLDILIRCSGNTKIQENPKLNAVLEKANNYVESYYYSEEEDNESEEGHSKAVMVVKYHPSSLAKALAVLDEPSLTSPKPRSLFWLIENKNSYLMDKDSYFAKALASQAAKRMTPIILPEGSHSDHTLKKELHANELAKALMEKYQLKSVLIGNIYHKQDSFHIAWTIHQENHPIIQGQTEHETLINALKGLVDQSLYLHGRSSDYYDKIARSYHLKILSEFSYGELQSLRKFLQEQASCTNIEVNSIEKDAIEISLDSKQPHTALIKKLAPLLHYIEYDEQTQTITFNRQYATENITYTS